MPLPPQREPAWKSYIVETTNPIFSVDECKRIIEIGNSMPAKDGSVGGGKGGVDPKIRRSKMNWLPFSHGWIYARVEYWMHTINNTHMGFHQMQIGEPFQFTVYDKKNFYNWHADSNFEFKESPPVRKMSMSILLNDPKEFKGGDMQLVDEKRTAVLKQGHGFFFASFLVHRVLPVKKGKRFSLVGWFGGSPLS